MRRRVDVEYTTELLKDVEIKAALLGVSRRKYLELATVVAIYNTTHEIKISVEEYVKTQNNN